MPRSTPIAVLGAGSWGTALALHLARLGNDTRLWGRNADEMHKLQSARENARYLPGIPFPDTLSATADLALALHDVRDVMVAVPSHAFRASLQLLKPLTASNVRIVWATKGFEHGAQALLSSVVTDEFSASTPQAVLSGPSFAKELAAGLPTAITLAANDITFRTELATRLHSDRFRVYLSDDMIGVQVGGAVKNVLAVGAGMCDGLGFGANARTALITRGLAEITRLGLALGGKPETFYGMAGLGDLILTCTDNQSRNRRFGLALGQGKTPAQAQAEIGQVVEAASNAEEVVLLARKLGIEMPISEQIYRILHDGIDPRVAAKELLMREMRDESSS
ncbi:NAD(P)H-dependent glycerol-3-phosphate dehydrogenase [Permianibacter sp. IMCC34836]|uniref:NAD(P)H-dependent glycerol-3-phosphate dehydrogenase n=1 Tax=Permianibacter fluminis TaxID=2738515 RepID=UPI0015549EC1|nr:NAD(P)H-dependent glycerol-3-phosphate dehydrogenase [Permianibacter fluminis]NQD36191.1 NAD(P)H-dependent glycerol-3-phosphate dehydrogenase [Permianibacter fluminis]